MDIGLLGIHQLAKSSQNCWYFKPRRWRHYGMRHLITILSFGFFSAFTALAQEATLLEAEPAPTAPAQTETTESLTISDQEFLKIPGESGQPAQDVLLEQDLTLTGEIPESAESDSQYVDPNAIIPDLSAETIANDPRTAAPTGEELDRKQKLLYREVRTKAEKDAAVTSLREQAEAAKTFEGERAAYREYYRALFRKMKQLDNSLSKKCDLMEKAYLTRLAQTRLEPTIPLEPPPKPQPHAN
ncbi:MAG: hypothetical protein RL630_2081 [Verrucomicrobiota bacterium]